MTKTLIPRYTSAVALPVEIKIPVEIAIVTGWPRLFVLKAGEPLPAPVVDWLRKDSRYARWIESAEAAPSAEATQPQGMPLVAEPGPELVNAPEGAAIVATGVVFNEGDAHGTPELETPTINAPEGAEETPKTKKKRG